MEKVKKYQDPALEIKRRHRVLRAAVIPFLISVLETISKNAMAWYGKLSLPAIFGSAQLSAIPGTAHILLKVLCLWAAGMLLRHGRDYPENNKELERITQQ